MTEIFYLTSKRGAGADAKGIPQEGRRFSVLKDSEQTKTISISNSQKYEKIKNIRDHLIETGIVVNFKFTQDYIFKNSSEASSVICGRISSGGIDWKNKDGISLRDINIDVLMSDDELSDESSDDEPLDTNKLVFEHEEHLKGFLIRNWNLHDLGREYDIYSENGETVGREYPTEVGRIDILATSKNKKTILVIELKRGRSNDKVLGQIQRYMGFVKAKMATKDQTVKGMIITSEDDAALQYALSITNNIEFYKYNISFSLDKLN
jgi:hypothetical protein